jgi:thiosulfate reductase/polysulfide reductase chain A
MSENVLWLNADMAQEMGLSAGEEVHLVNQEGATSAPIKLKPTQRIRRDCVYMVHGFGHTEKGLHFAKGRGADDSVLCTRTKIDPAMGGTGMSVNFVRIKKGAAAS